MRIGAGPLAGATTEAVRGVLHGVMAVYLAHYLNVPAARLPGEDGDRLDDLPSSPEEIRAALLDAFDRQRQVRAAGRLVARHLTLGYPAQDVVAVAHALLGEDASFHGYQMLEAGIRQFQEWGNTGEGRHILVAVARYLAAHSPTERAVFQTADIARRLLRGRRALRNSNASGNRPSPGPKTDPPAPTGMRPPLVMVARAEAR